MVELWYIVQAGNLYHSELENAKPILALLEPVPYHPVQPVVPVSLSRRVWRVFLVPSDHTDRETFELAQDEPPVAPLICLISYLLFVLVLSSLACIYDHVTFITVVGVSTAEHDGVSTRAWRARDSIPIVCM